MNQNCTEQQSRQDQTIYSRIERVIAYKKGLIRVTDGQTNYCVTGLTIYRKKPVEFEN